MGAMPAGASWRHPTTAAVVVAALLVGPQIAAKATRDALFLQGFDAASLPLMGGAAALASLFATLAFARLLARLTAARVLPAALVTNALLFLAEAALAPERPRAAAVLLYLHYATLGAVMLSSFWSLVSERFDPHAAKRAMGAIGAGASLGGVVGGLVAWLAAGHASPTQMLLGLALTSALGLAGALLLTRGVVGVSADSVPGSGLALVGRVPYLRNLALLVLLGAFLEALLDYALSAGAAAHFGRGRELLAFFALFHTATAALALVVQATLTQALLQGPGIAATLGLAPGFAALGAAAAAFSPGLGAVVGLRGGHAVLRNSAFRAAYELLYTPLPAEQRRPAKVVIDVGCDRIGTLLGSAAVVGVLATATSGGVPRAALALAALAAGLSWALTPRFRTDYVTALGESLRAGHVGLEPGAAVEPTTLLTLASLRMDAPASVRGGDGLAETLAALGSGNVARIEGVLARPRLEPALVPQVILLLADDALASSALRALRQDAGPRVPLLVAALLDERLPPAARRRVPRVLKSVGTQAAVDGLLAALQDPRFDVRYRSAQALLHLRERHASLAFPAGTVFERAAREADELDGSDGRLDHVFTLLSLVGDVGELELARRALRGGDARLRGTALEYLDNVLPVEVRAALFPHVSGREAQPLSRRSAVEVRDELRRSATALPRPPGSDDPDY